MTTYLVDTHALLWWLAADRRLPRRCQERIADPGHEVLVSAASAWEVAIKTRLGKLEAPEDLLDVVEASGMSWISVQPREAYAAGALPMHHRDPFDRLLVAQALAREAQVVSRDDVFDRYGVKRLWD